MPSWYEAAARLGARLRAAAGPLVSAERWSRARPWLVLVPLLAGLYVRVGLLKTAGGGIVKDGDGREYYAIAGSLARDGRFEDFPGVLTAFRMPLYPAFLSVFDVKDPDRRMELTAAGLIAVSLALVFAVYVLAGRVLPNGLALLLALLFAVRSAPFGVDVEIQGFYALFVSSAALCLVRYLEAPGASAALLCGVSAGLALQVRSVSLVLVAVCAAAMLMHKERVRHLSLLLLAVLLTMLPWAARNYYHFGRLVPFEDGASLANLYTATQGIDVCVQNKDIQFRDPAAAALYRTSGRAVQARLLKEGIKAELEAHPSVYLRGTLRRLYHGLLNFPLLPLGLLAAFLRREKVPLFLGGFCVLYIAAHAAMSTQPRYLFPALPGIYALSFYGVYSLFGGARGEGGAFGCRRLCVVLTAAELCLFALQARYLAAEVSGLPPGTAAGYGMTAPPGPPPKIILSKG